MPAPQSASAAALPPGPALLLSGNHFLALELRDACTAVLGEPTLIFPSENQSTGLALEAHLHELLATSRPSCIISVNMKGLDDQGIVATAARRRGIPLIVWFVDDPRPILLSRGALAKDITLALSWERAYLPVLRSAGFPLVSWLPLAADAALPAAPRIPGPRIPLSFVGGFMGGAFLADLRSRFLYTPALQPLIDAVAADLASGAGDAAGIAALLDAASRRLLIPLPFADARNRTWLHSCCIHTASALKRRATAAVLVDAGLQTFGDPGEWAPVLVHPSRAHPSLAYGPALFDIYSRSDININITSSQMPSAVNQRVFDVPAAGGFLLGDGGADMDALFIPGVEAITCNSASELVERVGYYAPREAERQAVVVAARARIAAEHTYAHRVRAMLGFLAGK